MLQGKGGEKISQRISKYWELNGHMMYGHFKGPNSTKLLANIDKSKR
jgi:hypothetical protein